MNRTKERLKSCILVVLIVFSAVQVYVYWKGDKLESFFERTYSNDRYNFLVDEFFRPDRIIVSEGFDESHWMLKKNSWEYGVIWEDAKSYIRDFLAKGDYKEVVPFDYDNWSNVIIRKSVLIEFDGEVDASLVSTFLGNSETKDVEPYLVGLRKCYTQYQMKRTYIR